MWKKIGKRPRLALVLAIAVAAAIGLIWQKLREPPPQIITLPNGEQFRFAGVTWGTNHVFGSMAGRLVNGLPRPVANFVWQHARTLLGQVNYYHYEQPSEPTLCVWFQPMGTNALSAEDLSPLYFPNSLTNMTRRRAHKAARICKTSSGHSGVCRLSPEEVRCCNCVFTNPTQKAASPTKLGGCGLRIRFMAGFPSGSRSRCQR